MSMCECACVYVCVCLCARVREQTSVCVHLLYLILNALDFINIDEEFGIYNSSQYNDIANVKLRYSPMNESIIQFIVSIPMF